MNFIDFAVKNSIPFKMSILGPAKGMFMLKLKLGFLSYTQCSIGIYVELG